MNQALRFAAAATMLLALYGCNGVVSVEPWFSATDAQDAPILRDGLWLRSADTCRFDETRPAERWPDCASAVFVRGSERWSMEFDPFDDRGRRRRTFAGWESETWLMASGNPLIVQAEVQSEPDDPASAPTGDDANSQEFPWRYGYAALRPTQRDDQGRVTAFEIWSIECGPLPERDRSRTAPRSDRAELDESSLEESFVTDRPFPGLTVIGDNCVAQSVEALREAAVRSENLGWRNSSRWVRDGWR